MLYAEYIADALRMIMSSLAVLSSQGAALGSLLGRLLVGDPIVQESQISERKG